MYVRRAAYRFRGIFIAIARRRSAPFLKQATRAAAWRGTSIGVGVGVGVVAELLGVSHEHVLWVGGVNVQQGGIHHVDQVKGAMNF